MVRNTILRVFDQQFHLQVRLCVHYVHCQSPGTFPVISGVEKVCVMRSVENVHVILGVENVL